MSPELTALLKSAREQETFREHNLLKTSEKVETVFIVPESMEQDQPAAEHYKVAPTPIGPPPINPPPPPPGNGRAHDDDDDDDEDVTQQWLGHEDRAEDDNTFVDRHEPSDDDEEDDDGSDECSSDEDVISVLAQTVVEESVEAAVREVNDADEDCSRYHDDGESDVSQEEGEWTFEENSPSPTLPHLTSQRSASLTQLDESRPLQEEVPVMRKTLTYEAPGSQVDSDPPAGLLLSSQTFTAETSNTTTTTHITKMVKGGVSETRVEKRIVISGETEEDHEQALAAALSEARRQHPELSVTRVVVHKETEVSPDHMANQSQE